MNKQWTGYQIQTELYESGSIIEKMLDSTEKSVLNPEIIEENLIGHNPYTHILKSGGRIYYLGRQK